MDFVVVVNKEINRTSRDIVNDLNKILGTKRIGHTGTLDPIATGVLVVCVGKYTKLVNLLTSLDKEYIATIKLGVKTDTLDITGNVIEEQTFNVDKELVINTLNTFLGKSIQEVPAYSAVKINGKKLYEYARNNEEIELPKRTITVNSIELLEFKDDLITFKVNVSKGTYIRSLIQDICTKLGTVGTMSSLIRTKQGMFDIENSYKLESIKNNNYKKFNVKELFNYEIRELTEEEYFRVKNGNYINVEMDDQLVILTYNGLDIAIYEIKNNIAKPYIML
ncbi:MAG: tRNA pseudouridine(55) synthase TruB [Bacilli bacterium]|nr:tRNA pseudouridine(55) synthase TruB [Bacilli bacterium]